MPRLQIAGIGRYLPKRVVTSTELEQLCGFPAGSVESGSGVRERRWADKSEGNAFMGAEAAREAMQDARVTVGDIDLIINASASTQQAIPETSPFIQQALGFGQSGIPCFTIQATCLSFLVALDMANALIASGRYRTILIVTSELSSHGINLKIPEVAALFGDAAAAAVVRAVPDDSESGVLTARLETYGDGAQLTRVLGGGSLKPPNDPDTRPEDNLFVMEGRKIFVFTMERVEGFLERLRPGLSKGLGSIKLVVPHQPSRLGLSALKRFNYPDAQVAVTLDRLGNCIAASIPATLYEAIRDQRVARGDEVLLLGTGAGLSFGGLILKY